MVSLDGILKFLEFKNSIITSNFLKAHTDILSSATLLHIISSRECRVWFLINCNIGPIENVDVVGSSSILILWELIITAFDKVFPYKAHCKKYIFYIYTDVFNHTMLILYTTYIF